MTVRFKDEIFRGDYTFRNSPTAIRRFPFPFDQDSYMCSVNIEPHRRIRAGSVFEHRFDVDEHYVAEMRDRAITLTEDPLRCQSLPHMELAGWDFLDLVTLSKAKDYPDLFELHHDGDRRHWINRPLEIDQSLTFLEPTTPPCGSSYRPCGACRVQTASCPIRCYLMALEDIVTVPKWGRRLHRVLRDLPDELVEYKGFAVNRPPIVDYLAKHDGEAATLAGIFPDE